MLPLRFSLALLAALLVTVARADTSPAASDPLAAAFATPPVSAKPTLWWFWGETVTTDHGITQDLEAMKRAGFGGVVIYEQVFTDRPDALKSLSPEWLARFRFAAAECARLGLTLETNISSGFVAGGPWITPALAMQRMVASELVIDGGRPVSLPLPQPPTRLDYYRDVAVLAYPAPSGADALPEPVRTSTPADIDLPALFSPDAQRIRIPVSAGDQRVLITLDYGRPVTTRSLTYAQRTNAKALIIATQMPSSWAADFYGENMRLNPPLGWLEVSDDGQSWQRVVQLPALGYQHDTWTSQTVTFPAATGRHFRLNFENWGRNLRSNDTDLVIGAIELRGEARIDQWERKTGNVVDFSNPDRTPAYTGDEIIDPARILDITSHLTADGLLTWDAPPGRWTILRLGHTPTGAKTKHGRPENMGLECDKLSAAAVRVQWENYVGVLLREVKKVPGAKLSGIGIDSNEHGSQNWTPDFLARFIRRRGYDLRAFLPVMMGRVVGSREQSDEILHDVRRTIADLMSDEYFGTFQKLCHAEGMTSTAQAPGIATCLPSDNIQAKGRTDIPMGEFWMTQTEGTIDCKEAASAAHVYGLPIAAAEAFTGSKADAHPAMMKPFADAALALGINKFVVLASVHQPWDDRKPGVTEDRFYLPYQRHNTWWEDSTPFWDTLSRSSHMLRQGLPVADLLYHLGNDTPLKIATHRMRPAPPAGYDYDVCGDEVLLTRTRVENGRIVLPDGMSYRILVLAGGRHLSLAAARHLQKLVTDGATVLGPLKPEGSASFSDGPAGDAEVRRIADQLWGPGPLTARGEKTTGLGRILWGHTPAEALSACNLAPDFSPTENLSSAKLLFTHRRTPDRDIYFVANHGTTGVNGHARFRVTGRIPERWNPETGDIATIDGWSETDGTTTVPLILEPHASTFIIFRAPTAPSAAQKPPVPPALVQDTPLHASIAGPWSVHFTPGWGAPEKIELPQLSSWTDHTDPGVRHYSGSATYTCTFDLPALPPTGRVLLDLGNVAVIASIKLNNHDLGIAWKSPYALDATAALRPGRNTLEVRVANLWVNRLIADSALPESERKTWVTWNPYKNADPLLPSGLLGPVTLRHLTR
ncbi:glycosyl hydrolase family 2 [Nibricoccus aquaticus]|uniref:Glycosyl hydrolase family 2 n=1 Tax=Nibricoccus aquaticus TaxID=2576891 RepID=A0A290Q3Z5_9BACT|nr:glycosyl hydrolase [Nibricoccus aquaticus]ATC63389.1 glycosyl hydrolase family 2 [Nibricoccus aquaticus]